MAKPPSTPHAPQRSERSASSVVARSVPAGGRALVMRPAVLAALVVLLALTVSLVVILMRPSGDAPGGGDNRPTGSSFFADDEPLLPPLEPALDAGSGPPAVPPATPDAGPPATPPEAAPDAAGPATEPRSRIVLLGLPAGAAAELAGTPFGGWPLEAVVPRSAAPLLLHVTAPGFRTYETSIAPSGDMQISVPLERLDDGLSPPSPDAGGGANRPPSTPRWPPRRPPTTPTYTPPRDAGYRPPGNNGLPLPENAPW